VPGRSLSIEQVLALLAKTPAHIVAATAGLTEAQLHASPNPGEWSANDVLAHLRSCADVWGDCIAIILHQDRPTIRAVNPRTWISRTDYLDLEFLPSLEAFAAQRAELLAVLKALKPGIWSRSATVKGAGKPLERTVQSYAEWMATPERPHVKQIERIASTMSNRQ
jgi:hypothetical protein